MPSTMAELSVLERVNFYKTKQKKYPKQPKIKPLLSNDT